MANAFTQALRGAVHQVNPFDGNRTFDTNAAGKMPGYRQANDGPTPSYATGSGGLDTSAYDREIEASRKATDALRAQMAAQPRLPMYDSAGAWARAQKGAEGVVNPVYLDKLNQYLEKAKLKRTQVEEQTGMNKEGIQTELNQTLDDTATARTRTGEDAATNMADISATEGEFQKSSGTQFDRARQALLDSMGDFSSSGIVKQQDTNVIADRNREEAAQTRQFEKERSATETLKSRTFEDLSKTEDRAQNSATSKTKQVDVDLKNFIDTAALDETDYRLQNETERQGAVGNEVNNQYSIGVRDFINSLVGSGARAQDIALAQQVYAR